MKLSNFVDLILKIHLKYGEKIKVKVYESQQSSVSGYTDSPALMISFVFLSVIGKCSSKRNPGKQALRLKLTYQTQLGNCNFPENGSTTPHRSQVDPHLDPHRFLNVPRFFVRICNCITCNTPDQSAAFDATTAIVRIHVA